MSQLQHISESKQHFVAFVGRTVSLTEPDGIISEASVWPDLLQTVKSQLQ